MSRENRRKAATSGSTATLERPPAPATPAPRGDGEQRQGTISWRHCLLGLVVGELTLLILSDGGLAIANAALGSDGRDKLDGGIVGVASFLAVLAGGYLAARLARRQELYQGFAVAVGFIIVAASYQFGQEASVVHGSLQSGTHTLLDLGPMNMGGLISGDFLALLGGSLGGMLARRRAAAGA
jgi:hypothetical protein